MVSGGDDPSIETARVTDGLVAVEREIERREVGIVATYRVTTENERPVAVRVVNDLPDRSTDGTGFHPSREPRWWTVEDGRLTFKDTVGSAAPATFEFGLAVRGGFDGSVSLSPPEIAGAEPVGVTREGDRVVFPGADADGEDGAADAGRVSEPEDGRGGLLSGVRSAVFGGGDDEVLRASDLDPDAMVVSRDETPTDDSVEPTQFHAANPTLTPTVVPVSERPSREAFSELSPETEPSDPAATEPSTDAGSATGDVLTRLLAELTDDAARARLREELGIAELERTREEVRELRAEVASLREEVAATADANETTAARVSELCRAVDGLAADLDGSVTTVPATPPGDDREVDT